MALARLWVCACVIACVPPSLEAPPQHRGWLRLWEEGEGCGGGEGGCEGRRCPPAPPGCPAGHVRDGCGCCEQCGNAEGQPCDPDGAQEFYGRCGEGLACQRRRRGRGQRGHAAEEPEPKCVCRTLGPVCGSDGQTYTNLCQLREAASRNNVTLKLTGPGPCYSAPRIFRAPRDQTNYTGEDIVFGCEVSSYPLPSLSWRREGSDNFLPGDDTHVSVQARGGPERYAVSTWLQIQGLRPSDSGVYHCISRNALGRTSASARLTVLRQERVMENRPEDDEEEYYEDTEEGSVEGQSGDYLG